MFFCSNIDPKKVNYKVDHSVPAISQEKIKIALAGDLAKLLHVKKADPILIRERFVYDPGKRPLEYNIGYYRSDKFTYSIEIKK